MKSKESHVNMGLKRGYTDSYKPDIPKPDILLSAFELPSKTIKQSKYLNNNVTPRRLMRLNTGQSFNSNHQNAIRTRQSTNPFLSRKVSNSPVNSNVFKKKNLTVFVKKNPSDSKLNHKEERKRVHTIQHRPIQIDKNQSRLPVINAQRSILQRKVTKSPVLGVRGGSVINLRDIQSTKHSYVRPSTPNHYVQRRESRSLVRNTSFQIFK